MPHDPARTAEKIGRLATGYGHGPGLLLARQQAIMADVRAHVDTLLSDHTMPADFAAYWASAPAPRTHGHAERYRQTVYDHFDASTRNAYEYGRELSAHVSACLAIRAAVRRP